MSILYVVSDRPGAGKTTVCMALAKLLRAQSKSVAAIKPVADGENDADAALYAQLLGRACEWLAGSGRGRARRNRKRRQRSP